MTLKLNIRCENQISAGIAHLHTHSDTTNCQFLIRKRKFIWYQHLNFVSFYQHGSGIARAELSVCLSICLSVTLWYCIFQLKASSDPQRGGGSPLDLAGVRSPDCQTASAPTPYTPNQTLATPLLVIQLHVLLLLPFISFCRLESFTSSTSTCSCDMALFS